MNNAQKLLRCYEKEEQRTAKDYISVSRNQDTSPKEIRFVKLDLSITQKWLSTNADTQYDNKQRTRPLCLIHGLSIRPLIKPSPDPTSPTYLLSGYACYPRYSPSERDSLSP